MKKHDTQYCINVSYSDELELFVANLVDGDPSRYGEGETRYEAMDNLLSNMPDYELEGFEA